MGYCMNMTDVTARLPKENIPGAVLALKELDRSGQKTGGGWSGGVKTGSWFAWVSETWAEADDIQELFEAWRYETRIEDDGYLYVDYFGGEKLGDDAQFWNALSPYMTGYVQMVGEDGTTWRWVLGGEKVEEAYPTWGANTDGEGY